MHIVLGILGIVGISLVIYTYIPIFKQYFSNKSRKTEENNKAEVVQHSLDILKYSDNEKCAAKAFISLMQLSYILIPAIVSEGSLYNDKVQCKTCCNFLDENVVSKLKALEGDNGTYTL